MSTDNFVNRHNGPRDHELPSMLKAIGVTSLDQLIKKTIPESIMLNNTLKLPPAMSEFEYLNHLRMIGRKNKMFRSFIGQGYYGVAPLSVIIRNVLENPSWYTSYTPYQAEISQGRLEALLNFQTMIIQLTGMEIANASLLDESTAAAEAMIMMFNARSRASVKAGAVKFFIDDDIFPQTIDVMKTRSAPLGIDLVQGKYTGATFNESYFGALVQYPAASGQIRDYKSFTAMAHAAGILVGVAADLMSLALLTPPGEWGADIVVGSNQRMGLPMSYGGPHAGFFATRDELKRSMPGRIIGVSVDVQGNSALRMALQTREQHIKRERATSNICTAQALLATMSGMYAQYHGPEGLKNIATHIHKSACTLNYNLKQLGYKQINSVFFDTLKIELPSGVSADDIRKLETEAQMNFFYPDDNSVNISTDEITTIKEIDSIAEIFAKAAGKEHKKIFAHCNCEILEEKNLRKSAFLQEGTFNRYHSETEMMRYIKMLERKDFSLTHSMISLGSCTMKLNPASSMFAMSWPEFGNIHPFVPADQAEGYYQIMSELGEALKEITGFQAISFQPNSGAAGEYAGLMVIREYHLTRGEGHRKVALIPSSAHGTNPASAAMAGMQIVVVECDDKGNISVDDLKSKAEANKENLACLMITYPSTHGVFEAAVTEISGIIHTNGGLVYMDGANMNAQVGLTSPGHIGADVCHLNLHKTFAIPHGGGGPGMGPILVNDKLAEFLPSHPLIITGGSHGTTAVAGAPFGSGHVLTISHSYVMMMGAEGLTMATKIAILNANYIAAKLKDWFRTLYTGTNGFVAHEMILDCRHLKAEAGITEADIAKRLMDYGFHAPTLSFPVHGTLMIEPTESESLQELDKFISAMISIANEINEIKEGKADREDNVLQNAPHTVKVVTANEWNHKYDRQKAAFPLKWVVENKFWPSAGRVDDGYGDRNLVCTCDPVDSYRQETLKP
ncbi:MAG: glycine dehydrogenase (aminomethyl-transferring) [Bacteroidetes bacterium GWE2_41_25]|nr:MAG: glycine dehydrogenase (aminomethyl-transferring) [Bacteroidetes bacterium GWA2_40_15]OFX93929.1 MAG: glycine dehydrogenase (aminomethyl-transferring) [Bacteroidetes bacterium GWE2_41_25]OFY00864.1 MAG: glycine dehydrogenase (aminomethyl-transferring) [Bacteroidetes bacterium GWC2_40_22]HBQ84252.1 glycine dehydrogenase (aminomethyl-transferring) [Bacteroidales bacterium]